MATPLDAAWQAGHPLPPIDAGDKYARGRVLVVGGSRRVPGIIGLTAEAALRVGAGKARIATVESAALPLGLRVPEAGMVALPETAPGEIAAAGAPLILEQLGSCDTLVLGPAMASTADLPQLLGQLLGAPREGLSLLLDAAPMTACADGLEQLLADHGGRVVMTPHHGEMAQLLGWERERVAREPEQAALAAADRFHAVVVLKDRKTLIASPDGIVLHYASGCPGLGTAGSGDVLAGVIGGLLARGAEPTVAAGWGAWLHGAAGLAAAERIGPTGFLARELLPELPRLIGQR
jgi:hydroxyethylthiazole kinase-like uncharacterized protein yjeF